MVTHLLSFPDAWDRLRMRGMHISRARAPKEEGGQWGQSTTEEQDSQGKEVGEEGSEEEESEKRGRLGKKGERREKERGEGVRERGAGSLSNTPSQPTIYLGNSCSTLECSFTT